MGNTVILGRRVGAVLVLVSIVVLLVQLTDGSSDGPAAKGPAAHVAPGAPTRTATTTGRHARPAQESRQAQLDDAVRKVLAQSGFVSRGGGQKREIALTFDDGPGPYTPKVLVALNRLNVKATFFHIGQQEQTFHTASMAEFRRGHVIGDHTESHPHLASLSAADQHDQLRTPIQWLSLYGLPRPLLFRPPYGSYDQTTLDQLKRLGMLMVLWTVDSDDYRRPGVEQIVDTVVSGARPGAIMLLHDGGGDRSQTVAAIPKIVGRLRAKHYHLVTVPQLLLDDPPPSGRPLPQLHSEG